MIKWKPYDIIILILAITISIVLIVIFIVTVFNEIPIADTNAKIVGGLLASIISIISMYIGAQIQKRKE